MSVGSSGKERQITNVAAGQVLATSTDAINGSQLNATNQAINSLSAATTSNISSLSTDINSLSTGLSATNSNVALLSTSTSTAIYSLSTGLSATNSSVSSLSTSTLTGLSTVQSGVNSLSTSLSATNGNVASLSTGMTNVNNTLNRLSTTVTRTANNLGIAADMNGTGSDRPTVTAGSNSVAIGANSRDGGRSNVVSVGSDTQQRQITNVAPGTQPTDAVNLQQLNSGMNNTLNQANNYTNSQVQSLRNNIDSVQKDSDGGAAAAMAVAGLPQPTRPGMNMVALASSVYRGQSGQALGLSRISENGRWVYKGAVTLNTRGAFGFVVGGGYQW
ncbi:YadA family autotransporter adhesin [Burkholderia ubonensis]|uniref:YadA family autotransporter adhesin n=1 Tax=Burkholderia ubonensis TaxID=101571 RepID=UPI001E469A83|nr:YadA-like family protein [Burkholderia ubonensis]